MGSAGCKITPSVSRRIGRETVTKPSKLFQDIYAVTKDRELTKYLYGLSKSESFRKSAKDLKYDDMGEVTYTSLMESLNLTDIMEKRKDLETKKKEYGLRKGSAETRFDSYEEANSIAEEINRKEEDYVAVIQKEDSKYKIDLRKKDAASTQEAEQISFNNALNNELLQLLHDLGFDVNVVDDPRFAGLFDPTNATFVDGLIQAIKISRGELGEQAFPEEVCHLLLEGLMNHPLVQRLMNTIDDATIREVLGEQYEQYVEKYNGDSSRLQKEAAGKMLAEYIQKKGTIQESIKPRKSLLSRVWNFIKSLLSKPTDVQLNTANKKAREAIADIYKGISDRSILEDFSKDMVLNGEQLYQLTDDLNTQQKIADKAMTLTAKRIHLEKINSKSNRYSEESANIITTLQAQYENEQYQSSIFTFLADALGQVQEIRDAIEDLQDLEGGLNDIKSSSNIHLLKEVAKILRKFEDLHGGYAEFVSFLSTLDAEDNYTELGLSEDDAARLANSASEVMKLLNKLNLTYHKMRADVIYAFTRTLYGEDRAREIGSDRDKVMTLDQILDHANRDLGFMDRYISAMSEADDALLTLIDKAVKQQKYARDQELIKKKALLGKADEALRKAGYTSDFMFEKDSKGVPTGRIISEYDFDTYNKELKEFIAKKRAEGLSGLSLHQAIKAWKFQGNNPRLIKIELGSEDRYEYVPNPAVYSKNANRIKSLPKTQQDYYNQMIAFKKEMMTKIPARGQHIYSAIYISKSDIDGILTNNDGNAGKAALEAMKKRFVRRADDLGFGDINLAKQSIADVLKDKKKDNKTKAEEIAKIIEDNLEDNEMFDLDAARIESIVKRKKLTEEEKLDKILTLVQSSSFYELDTDFAGHRIEKLPIYYSRKLKDMRMLSLDFSGSMLAYMGMAINYEKMNEIVDLLELTRGYTKERTVQELEGDKTILTKFEVMGKAFTSILGSAGSTKNIGARIDDYFRSAVYEIRKNDEGAFDFMGNKVDISKTIDTIKDYTGLLGLGLNVFSALSNVTVGKLQQWIEAQGGEYFGWKDYGNAVKQYSTLLPGCVGEMSSSVKKNKLSLIIDKFDVMQDYYDRLRESNYYSSTTARILSKHKEVSFIGMNAGEHLLHCQTALAILNNIKLTDKDGKHPISLFDALEVKNNKDGIPELTLKEGLFYEKDVIDRKTGKPVKDKDGKIKTERVQFTEDNMFKIKNRIYKVNQSLNGAFAADDKGAIHKYALGRMAMQFRQWMPAHYYRRFARAHYDAELEQWREGYYNTLYKFNVNLIKSIKETGFDLIGNYKKVKGSLSKHEVANLKRAYTEIGIFALLTLLCKLGGRVKDKGSSWAEKMIAYQLNRMRVECGASCPSPTFFSNIFTILQSPAAAIKPMENFVKIFNFGSMLDEVTTGEYAGWSEWEVNMFKTLPYAPQVKKWNIEESMVTYMQNS